MESIAYDDKEDKRKELQLMLDLREDERKRGKIQSWLDIDDEGQIQIRHSIRKRFFRIRNSIAKYYFSFKYLYFSYHI